MKAAIIKYIDEASIERINMSEVNNKNNKKKIKHTRYIRISRYIMFLYTLFYFNLIVNNHSHQPPTRSKGYYFNLQFLRDQISCNIIKYFEKLHIKIPIDQVFRFRPVVYLILIFRLCPSYLFNVCFDENIIHVCKKNRQDTLII